MGRNHLELSLARNKRIRKRNFFRHGYAVWCVSGILLDFLHLFSLLRIFLDIVTISYQNRSAVATAKPRAPNSVASFPKSTPYDLQPWCCCGFDFLHISCGNVAVALVSFTPARETFAVALVSWTSTGEMLLWHRFRTHWLKKCWCGVCFVGIGWRNLAAALVSWTSAREMLLWH